MISALFDTIGRAHCCSRYGIQDFAGIPQKGEAQACAKLSRSTRSVRVHRVDNYPTNPGNPHARAILRKVKVVRMWGKCQVAKTRMNTEKNYDARPVKIPGVADPGDFRASLSYRPKRLKTSQLGRRTTSYE